MDNFSAQKGSIPIGLQTTELPGIAMMAVDKVIEREENLSNLSDRAEELQAKASAFTGTPRSEISRGNELWRRNKFRKRNMIIVCVVVTLVVILIIVLVVLFFTGVI